MVRRFEARDRQDFMKMAEDFYALPAVLHDVPKENFESTFRLLMEGSPFVDGYLAEYNGETAGYVLLSLTHSNEAGGLVVWIEEMYVKDAFRSCGIGKEFFAHIRSTYDSRAKRYRMEVTAENTRAIQLYKTLGYEPLEYMQMVKDL